MAYSMKLGLAASALFLGSQALVNRATQCCFHLTAQGGPGGQVKQLSDGQNRIGQANLPQGQYCIDGSGGLTDSHGRGCIFASPSSQWQCDEGKQPTPRIAISSNGTLDLDGISNLQACPTGDHGAYNIYFKGQESRPGCVAITLEADACMGKVPSGTVATTSPTTPAGTHPPMPNTTCPMKLQIPFEFPHLIIPIDEIQANKCHGTSYNGTAVGSLSSIFNFDIPPAAVGKLCNLHFLFPNQSQLETSAYSFQGSGTFGFAMLAAAATQYTTYATAPGMKHDYGQITIAAGFAYAIAQFACPAGEAIGFWMYAVGKSELNYFQDSNTCPIGLYLTTT